MPAQHSGGASRSRFDPAQGRLDALLSPAERAHVDRHHREADQRRLRLSRALLRLLLARYLEREPGRIPVERRCPTCARPHGKPRLWAAPGFDLGATHLARSLPAAGPDLRIAELTGPEVGLPVPGV